MSALTRARTLPDASPPHLPAGAPIRVLIVDDSIVARAVIARAIETEPDLAVVAQAGTARAALELLAQCRVDAIILDLEMPGGGGLEALPALLAASGNARVLIVSSAAATGAEATVTALRLGAADTLLKPKTGFGKAFAEALVERLRRLAPIQRGIAPASAVTPLAPVMRVTAPHAGEIGCVAIGASTGGVEALIELLADFPANCPPTVIVQHMPAAFTPSFAARLDRLCRPKVVEARAGAVLGVGTVYLAPGGDRHMEIAGSGQRRHCRLFEDDKVNGHRPSVDRLFHSVSRVAGRDAVGAILTGMGNDGAEGLRAMRGAGSATFGQDEATSVVYGMPGVAHQIGAVQEQLPLRRIASRLLAECRA